MAVNRPATKEISNMFAVRTKLLEKGKKKKAVKALKIIMTKIQAKHVILKLPVHGGFSLMLVETREPRVNLQYIPHPDSIFPPPYVIRGLNLKDVDEMIEKEMVYKAGEW
tara:strand:- start:460 stop:789 length:330 start_codon:yes stop_codon:yes gene_type:complete